MLARNNAAGLWKRLAPLPARAWARSPASGWTVTSSIASRSPSDAQRGSVTAETAIALPALVFVFAVGLWGEGAAGTQLSCIDAARAGARAAARGEPLPAVQAAVERVAPKGSRITVARDSTLTHVNVHATVRPPGGHLLPALELNAQVDAATEPGIP